jgi:GntR family transcriptional repressor for pyruvate dehydrogenase complex
VDHVRHLIEKGGLDPGDRLPSERDLALELGVSRPSVRSGLEALESMGVVVSRRGAGTFIADGPPDLGVEPLSLLASLHHFTPSEMFEARLVLETGVAGLAAEHAEGEPLAAMAEEVTEMFASLEDPTAFLRHDVRFHRAIAAGCGNRVLAALMEMVSAQFYELRKDGLGRGPPPELHRRTSGPSGPRREAAASPHRAPEEGRDPDLRQAGPAGRTIGGGAWVIPLWT